MLLVRCNPCSTFGLPGYTTIRDNWQSWLAMPLQFDSVWERIRSNAGADFRMIRGARFRYTIIADHVIPDRTKQQIPKSHFGRARQLVPMASTAPLQQLRGPSFIYAILMDARIRQSDCRGAILEKMRTMS